MQKFIIQAIMLLCFGTMLSQSVKSRPSERAMLHHRRAQLQEQRAKEAVLNAAIFQPLRQQDLPEDPYGSFLAGDHNELATLFSLSSEVVHEGEPMHDTNDEAMDMHQDGEHTERHAAKQSLKRKTRRVVSLMKKKTARKLFDH